MATESPKSLPKITTKNWWGIRKKLKATMPKNVSASFVAAAMSIKESSAKTNVVGPMKQLGLLDENGTPTPLANKWRDDSKYAEACAEIREKSYPQELLDLAPDTDTDRATVQSWIAGHSSVGSEAARQAASVYMLLLDADPSKEGDAAKPAQNKKTTKKAAKRTKKPAKKDDDDTKKKDENGNGKKEKRKPKIDQSLNINLQIHISADTSAEQIDKIFKSMAKHLKSISEG